MTSMTTTGSPAPLLERARSAMPGHVVIEAGLAAADDALSRIDRDGQPEWSAVDDAVADVLAGLPIPGDLGSRVLAVRKGNEATGVAVQALTRLKDSLRVHQRETQVRHADRALGVVATELDAVLTAARPVLAALGNIDSADAAIKAGLVDEWRTAGDLGARYTEVRAAQLRISEDALNPDNRVDRDVALLIADHGFVRDADQLDDAVGTDPRQQPVDQSHLVLTGGPTAPATRPWNSGNGRADLRYVCRPGVRPWLPTIPELTGARAELKARRRETERVAAGLPDAGTSMFQATAYTPRPTTTTVRPMPGDDARRAVRLRAPGTDAGRITP